MEYTSIIQSLDRLASWMNRMKWICHLAIFVPSAGLFFISLALYTPMLLMTARFLHYDGRGLIKFSLAFYYFSLSSSHKSAFGCFAGESIFSVL